jgi:glycosyltransferase involved in cell wall biosynthesis
MKILHIMASQGLGGAETYATDMILSLHKAGVDQAVVMSRHAPRFAELRDAGVRLFPTPLSWPLRFLQRGAVCRLIAAEKPDLIHCWMRRAASLLPPQLPVPPLPVIGWFGGYYEPRHFTRCTHFVGVTEDIRRHTIERGIAPEKATYVPTFPDIQEMPAADRATLSTPEDVPVLLALSRLHSKKGLDTLILAAQQLQGVHVWLAGEGPLRAELEKLTDDLEMTDRVHFLGWRTDRAALLQACDICVLPSRYEPFGTVILEAWAAKTPFVACKSAGPLATVRDGSDGLLVEIDDVDGLASALSRVLKDGTLREKIVAAGYARYQAEYTRPAVTAQMRSLYERLISEGKNKHGQE